MNNNTKTYAFILGRERGLCLSELKAVLSRFCFDYSIISLYDNVAIINIADKAENDVVELMNVFGGTVKIFRIIGRCHKAKEGIEHYIRSNLRDSGKFNYGISSYSRQFNQKSVNNLGLSIKKELKKQLSLRFIELREGQEVSSILSLKSKLVTEGYEFGLFETGDLGILISLSNAEEWSYRDYGKPRGDKRSGMLPPKLARMMINLALGETARTQEANTNKMLDSDSFEEQPAASEKDEKNYERTLVIDPFCGSGNILIEALLIGLDVFGSDVSERAVEDTMVNVDWLVQDFKLKNQNLNSKFDIIKADATNTNILSSLENSKLAIADYDRLAIITEPYLGEPKKFKSTLNAVRGEYKQIQELYLKFFNIFSHFKKYRPVFCVVFPLVETVENEQYSLYAETVDELRKIGYTSLQSPLIYGRDYQVVKREIALLTLRK